MGNFHVTFAFFDELVRSGVRHVCVCPGSRSAPLAIAAAETEGIRAWPHIDERSAAFFALGIAKACREPVALVCTSGTAAANFFPAVVEAHYAGVPLVVLTADRPAELRDWGAGQTIDQPRMFGSHVRWFAEMPTPGDGVPGLDRHARAMAQRVWFEAASGPGPVHLNFPFREPLAPESGTREAMAETARNEGDRTRAAISRVRPVHSATPEDRAWLWERVRACRRGVVMCGPCDRPDLADAVVSFAAAAGWPVLADATSQLRCGPHTDSAAIITRADSILRVTECFEGFAPDLILRIGQTPVSKVARLWLEHHVPRHFVSLGREARWQDPSHLATRVLSDEPEALLNTVARRLEADSGFTRPNAWSAAWERAEAQVREVQATRRNEPAPMQECSAIAELLDALPADAGLFVSNSMPIRDLDLVLDTRVAPLRIFCNRGANGIDGIVSTALGTAVGRDSKVALLTGDLAFLHDVSGLLHARRIAAQLVIVVINNNGGGIFSKLPVAESANPDTFERFFRTPHDVSLESLCRGVDLPFVRSSSLEHFRTALKDAFHRTEVSVLEVPVDPQSSAEERRSFEAAVRGKLRAFGESGVG